MTWTAGLDSSAVRCVIDLARKAASCTLLQRHSDVADDTALALAVLALVSLAVSVAALRDQHQASTRDRWAALYHSMVIEPVRELVVDFHAQVGTLLTELEVVVAHAKNTNCGVNDLNEQVGEIVGRFRAASSAFQANLLMRVAVWSDVGLRSGVLKRLLNLQDVVSESIAEYRGPRPTVPAPPSVFEKALSEVSQEIVFFDIGDPMLRKPAP